MADSSQQGKGSAAATFAERLIAVGIDGKAGFASAESVAAKALDRYRDREAAIRAVINGHTRLAAAEGFITGVGGFVVMVVSIPANVAGFYLVATRMVAAIAKINGHDVRSDAVRTAVLLCLAGEDASDVLAKVGIQGAVTGRLLGRIASGLSPAVMMAINKGVAFRLMARMGRGILARFGRGIPVAGGVLGAGMDAFLVRQLAKAGRREFPVVDADDAA